MALSSRRLPFLLRVPASPVPRSQRYYEGATTSHPLISGRSLVRSRSPPDSSRFVLAAALPEGRRSLPGPGFGLAGCPSFRLLSCGREWDLSGLQAILPVPLLRSRTPVEPTCPRPVGHIGAAPAGWTAKASAMSDFGANTQLRHTLPYASRGRCRTRARLASSWPASLCWEGVEPPGSRREVSARVDDHSPLLLS
jgi:hypothetical protein